MGQMIDKTPSSLTEFTLDNDENWFGSPSSDTKPKKDMTSVLKEAGIKNTKEDNDEGSGSTKLDAVPDKKKPVEVEQSEAEVEFSASDFGETEEEEEEEKKSKTKVKSEETKPEVKKEVKKEEEDSEEEEEEEDEDDDDFYTNLAVGLKEEGLFSKVELKEGKKLSKEEFKDKFEEELDLRLEEELDASIEEFIEGLKVDKDAAAFIRYKKTGGNTADYFKMLQVAPPVTELDEEDAAQIEKVIIHHLMSVEGKDAEDAKDYYDALKSGSKHVDKAKKWFAADKAASEKEAKRLEEDVKAADKKKKADFAKFSDDLEDAIAKAEKVKGLALTKEDKKVLKSYIQKPSVEVKGRIYPPITAKLNAILNPKTPEDMQSLIFLAKLFKDDFKLPEVEVEAESRVADRVIRGIDNAKKGLKRTRNSKVNGGKHFADHF